MRTYEDGRNEATEDIQEFGLDYCIRKSINLYLELAQSNTAEFYRGYCDSMEGVDR